MPSMPPTARYPGQRSRQAERRGYDERRREQQPWRAWYQTKEWKAKRAEQLAREPYCRACAEEGRVTPASVCDHVEPHRGDPVKFWQGETQSLCKPCHDGAKQREERAMPDPRSPPRG